MRHSPDGMTAPKPRPPRVYGIAEVRSAPRRQLDNDQKVGAAWPDAPAGHPARHVPAGAGDPAVVRSCQGGEGVTLVLRRPALRTCEVGSWGTMVPPNTLQMTTSESPATRSRPAS